MHIERVACTTWKPQQLAIMAFWERCKITGIKTRNKGSFYRVQSSWCQLLTYFLLSKALYLNNYINHDSKNYVHSDKLGN